MISELQLKNLLKHFLVFEYYNRGDDALCIKEYLPLCAALLYPYVNTIILEDKDTKETIIPIIKSIKKYTNRQKGLQSFSLEGLRHFFGTRWLQSLDLNIQKILLNGISLISDIQDDGSFSIKGNEKVYTNYLNGRVTYPDVSNNYGTEEYIVEEGAPDVSKERLELETSKKDKESPKPNVNVDNSPFIRLYDKLKDADPENRNKARFVWQWFLRLDEYESIKKCLANHKIPKPSSWDNKTVRLLALYIGEFYKREYENNVNPFIQLGKETPNYSFGKQEEYKKICEILSIKAYRLNKQVHLFTLYVNGGLPIHNISSKLDDDNSNKFIEGLSKLLDAEDEIDKAEGEEALGKVTNTATALRESFCQGSGHSIFEYIQAIITNSKTWDESDGKYSDFCDFTEKIKEANKKAVERKKFKLAYTLWTYNDEDNHGFKEFVLKPQLRFNPEEDGERHYAISKQRLIKWGLTNPPSQFSLRIGDEILNFTICCNGDYLSWDMVDRIDLPVLSNNLDPEDLLHNHLNIFVEQLDAESHQIEKDYNLPFKRGFLQFYTNDNPSMASWSSYKGARSFLWSGLLYDKKRFHLLSDVSTIDLNDFFGWVYFTDFVSFEDSKKGKIHTFYNSKGRIYAKPSAQSLHKKIIESPCIVQNYLLEGLVKCTIRGEQSHAYIIKSSNIVFDVFRVANDEKVNITSVVEYKSAKDYIDSTSLWNKYTSKNLEQGLYVFRLSNARYSTEIICYVLPENAKISYQSDSTPYLIKFNNFANVIIEGLPSTHKNNIIIYRITNNNVDAFDVTIGDSNGCILLQIYHPKPQTHIFLYGKELIQKPILIAYADEIEVKYISTHFCSNFHLFEKNEVYKRLFDALTATVTGKRSSLLTERIKIKIGEKESNSSLEVRIYTQEFQKQLVSSSNMYLLDLENNQVVTLDDSNLDSIQDGRHNKLLFQSLKDLDYTDVYYAPKFISKSGQKVANNEKNRLRTNRLTQFVNENPPAFLTDYAYQQFEIASEHKLFFAVFDSLISLCWDAKKNAFLDVGKKPFKKNLLNFLVKYITYATNNSKKPSVAGLKRLAREFLFDWESIRKDVENNSSQQLKDLYQEIINN